MSPTRAKEDERKPFRGGLKYVRQLNSPNDLNGLRPKQRIALLWKIDNEYARTHDWTGYVADQMSFRVWILKQPLSRRKIYDEVWKMRRRARLRDVLQLPPDLLLTHLETREEFYRQITLRAFRAEKNLGDLTERTRKLTHRTLSRRSTKIYFLILHALLQPVKKGKSKSQVIRNVLKRYSDTKSMDPTNVRKAFDNWLSRRKFTPEKAYKYLLKILTTWKK